MTAWALEPSISSRQSLRSKPIEALIRCMIADGPAANRPPHRRLAPAFVSDGPPLLGGGLEPEELLMTLGPIACLRREGLTRIALAALALALSATPGRADSDLPGKPG